MKANASGPSLMEKIEQDIGNLTMIKLIESDKMGEGAKIKLKLQFINI